MVKDIPCSSRRSICDEFNSEQHFKHQAKWVRKVIRHFTRWSASTAFIFFYFAFNSSTTWLIPIQIKVLTCEGLSRFVLGFRLQELLLHNRIAWPHEISLILDLQWPSQYMTVLTLLYTRVFCLFISIVRLQRICFIVPRGVIKVSFH